MSLKNNEFYEFINIVEDIINDQNFIKLRKERHHGSTNRYDHLIRVGIKVYKHTKRFNLDYITATKAAVLHDYFFEKDFKNKKDSLHNHPKLAAKRAHKYFNLNEKGQDMIKTHMFPVTLTVPNSLEGVILSLMDKSVSIKEFFKYNIVRRKNIELSFKNDLNKEKKKFKEKEMLLLTRALEE